ncbi:hypothetical protein [Microbacterium murale]|uniref:Nuclear transport factor 2 family protein n=1 Tax=Microbacterium murale TaxID=1081040 RepID=A0ABU0P3K1_9MICO|nr:hypothetical protein [Microbacterium murale]MDQ0641920.1 hypothetical protein [Microbacterium murale]
MTLPRSKSTRIRMLTLLALTAAALSACTPTPEPTPTPTAAFASEEEAFAAAEEVYRAYNDALNEVDVSDASTFEALYALTSGDFEAADRKTFSQLQAENYTLWGEARVALFQGKEATEPYKEITALVCVDVSNSGISDEKGRSVVPSDRPDINALRVTFVNAGGDLLIDHADREESSSCASS